MPDISAQEVGTGALAAGATNTPGRIAKGTDPQNPATGVILWNRKTA